MAHRLTALLAVLVLGHGNAALGATPTGTPAPNAAGESASAGADPAARPSRFSWGWRAGAGGTAFTEQLAEASDGSVVGFDAGAYASLDAGWLSLEPQALFAMRGGNFVDTLYAVVFDPLTGPYLANAGEYRATLSLYELRAPVLVRLRVAPLFFEPHLFGGVVPALLIHPGYSGDRGGRDFGTGAFRRAGVGWMAGLGSRWPTAFGALTIDLRYETAGAEVFKSGRGLSGREQAWMLGFGVQMRPGGPPRTR